MRRPQYSDHRKDHTSQEVPISATDAGDDAQADSRAQRLPGRVEGQTSYASAEDLMRALKRAEAAHAAHEAQTGEADPDWPQWYAEYMVREQSGADLPR